VVKVLAPVEGLVVESLGVVEAFGLDTGLEEFLVGVVGVEVGVGVVLVSGVTFAVVGVCVAAGVDTTAAAVAAAGPAILRGAGGGKECSARSDNKSGWCERRMYQLQKGRYLSGRISHEARAEHLSDK
jgi:hypothetical protein